MVEHDPLTGLTNRRQLYEALEQLWHYALRHQQPLSIMVIDIDFFEN
ncbi:MULTISPECIES: GGDEF domain-containing protein [unclassified Acinetobacter]|nr:MULTISPECIES: GGDEF domain-containing protein [unclassified Acinetobacter]UUS64015.1 GGDEF domain-containing protein [Acinetobacter sp. YH12068_T]